MKHIALCFATALCLPLLAQKSSAPQAGADQTTPSLAQYFTWINNTNEGTTEAQTLANLAFFQWLRDEYGMVLDIYAFDAGFVDGKNFTGILEQSPRFRRQFPKGLDRVYQAAKKMNTRLGHWGGPDGFGDSPESEKARMDMMVNLCRNYDWALYKFDLVCGDLRPEKEASFIAMMQQSRVHSPDLIALNHRLPLGKEGLSLMTTNLWDGQETYIDVHITNKGTAPHHRACSLERGNTDNFDRLMEDHGVCISSCLNRFDDELILQAFGRNLILAPEIYGNPWLLRDDEFAKLARIFNLARRYRDILINAIALPEKNYGANAVSRGNGNTRLLTLRNLSWQPVTYEISASAEIGLAPAEKIELRQLHPTENIIATIPFGTTQKITVPPFRSCLLLATSAPSKDLAIAGCDYQVVRDVPGKSKQIRLLGMPGTTAEISLPSTTFSTATIDGKKSNDLLKGKKQSITFPGKALTEEWHRELATAAPAPLPADAMALYEATCFAADNNAFEARSLQRSGPTAIPAVKAARDAFFGQHIFKGRGLWDKYLFDGDATTGFHISRKGDPRVNDQAMFRVDFGSVIIPDMIEITIPDQYSLGNKCESEGGTAAEFSTDLKTWISIPFIHGEQSEIYLPKGTALRYMRIANFQHRICEINAFSQGKPLPRDAWRASNLFSSFSRLNFTKAWTAPLKITSCPTGSYLCVALNGKHGVEGAYAAIRTADGHYIGAPDRASSFPCNPWEHGCVKHDKNYTYYIPLTPELIGKSCEVVVIGTNFCEDSLQPEVWQTCQEIPFSSLLLELDTLR
jgi:hypothetical protein